MSLTEKQVKAKKKAEAAGQVFLPPSQYKAMMQNRAKPKYSKSSVKANPQQVATYSVRKAYKKDMAEISPDTDLLIDQCLNPEDVNVATRWPNTYGLSATYKCKNVISARFAEDNRCCVAVRPSVKNAIYTTSGVSTSVPLKTYFSSATVNNPFSYQEFLLDSTADIVNWSEPVDIGDGQALLPFPSAQTGLLLYPVRFAFQGDTSGTYNNIFWSLRLINAAAHQCKYRLCFLNEDYQFVYDSAFQPVGSVANPAGIGADNGQPNWGNAGQAPNIRYMALQIAGTTVPFKGSMFFYFHHDTSNGVTATLVAPNHAQHVTIYDIRDADTITESATQAFVLAQSLLVTAEMSDLNNGGMLSVARVPGNTVVGLGDDGVDFSNWYEWIASLPYNSYDGPVKKGAYSWYLPDDETGFFYKPLNTDFGRKLPYIVSEFTVSDSTEAAVVRIKVCTIVQFTTTSSVYECRPSCHVTEMEFMHHLLSLVQASYSNDGHIAGLKKMLASIKPKLLKLLKNPKTYTTAAQILSVLGQVATMM